MAARADHPPPLPSLKDEAEDAFHTGTPRSDSDAESWTQEHAAAPCRPIDAHPSDVTADSDDGEADAPSPTSVRPRSPVAAPSRCSTGEGNPTRYAPSAAAAKWSPRSMLQWRGGNRWQRTKTPRPVALSRVVVLSESIGEAPLPPMTAAASVAEAGLPGVTGGLWRSSRPPAALGRPVSAAVDEEIDALDDAGWWVCAPSPTALVRAASEDVSADAALYF
ncbi:hypothetical protein MMPV_002079 [Pyropia vietnamensis]